MTTPRHLLIPCLALATVLLGACGGDDDTVADPTEESTSSVTTEAAEPADGDVVTLERSRFAPDSLEVAAGTEVTFENLDSYAHTVTSAEGSAVEFSSGELAGGETFAQSFDEAGTYSYFCEIHPTMRGEVVVG